MHSRRRHGEGYRREWRVVGSPASANKNAKRKIRRGGVAFLCAKTRRFSRNRDLVCMAPPSIALLARPPGPTYARSRARSGCFFIRIWSLRKEIRKSFFFPLCLLASQSCPPPLAAHSTFRSISRLSDTSLRAPVKERQGGTKYNRTFSRETTKLRCALRFPTRKVHCKKATPFRAGELIE